MSTLKTLITAAMLTAISMTATARTALDFFTDIPAGVFNMLSRTTRLDMIDYYNAGLTTGSDNVFSGKARILKVSDNAVDILVAKNSLATIAVLPNGSDTVVALIETVRTPTPDSSLSFFKASDWTPVDVKLPVLADFMTPEAKKAELTAADYPDMTFTSIEFDPETGIFTFRDRTAMHYSLPQGLPPEIPALKYIRGSIERCFKGGRLAAPPRK